MTAHDGRSEVPAQTRLRVGRDLRDLGPGWDTYGARPISGHAIRTAESLAIVPTNNGGIQLEMHVGGLDVEIEISDTGGIGTVLVGRS